MRVLRSRSDQEVSSAGFALFVAGVILAGFIGGAIRTLLASNQIQSQILTQLQSALPDLEVKMGSAKVFLARGFWPGVSIYIPHLHLSKPETCGQTYGAMDLDGIDLPLNVFSLLSNHVSWDVVSVDKLVVKFNRKNCPAEFNPFKKASNFHEKINKSEDTAQKIGLQIERAFSVASLLHRQIDGLDIHSMEISTEQDPSWRVGVQNFSARTGKRLKTSAMLRFEKKLPGGPMIHEAVFSAQADSDQVKWVIRSPWKEGLIQWTGRANHVSDHLEQHVQITQVPVKDVLSEIQTWIGAAKGGSPRFIWLSCDLNQSGSLKRFEKLPMNVSDCRIEGDGEQIRAEPDQQVWPWERTPLHEPLLFTVNRVSLQTLLDLAGQKGLPVIIPKPGQWTGEIQFSNPRTWRMDGILEGAEVTFSNESVRGRQVISSVKTLIQSEKGTVHIGLSEVKLDGGQGKGSINFTLDPGLKNGEFDVAISALSLNSNIQDIMTGGMSSPIAINGRGRLERGALRQWKGGAVWESSQGHGWAAHKNRIDTNYDGTLFTVRVHIHDGEIGESFPFFSLAKTVFGDLPGPPWKFRDGQGRAVVTRGGGTVEDVAVVSTSGKRLRFQGTWMRGGELIGALIEDASHKRWKLRGWDGRLVLDEL